MKKVILLASLFFLVFATYAQNKGNDCSSAIPYEINSGSVAGYMVSPDVYWYTFTLYADYTDVLITTCISETSINELTLFSDCEGTVVANGEMCDEAGGNYNKTITLANLTAGTYYVSVEGPMGPGSTGAYTFEVSGNTTALTNDLAVTDIRKPVKNFNDNMQVRISIKNFGISSQTVFPVSYTFEGNTVTETFNETINPGESVQYTFLQTVDLSTENTYSITAKTELTDDENTANDEYYTEINTFINSNALFFAGDDYVAVPDTPALDFTDNFTIETWFYVHSASAAGKVVSKHGNDGTNRSGYSIEYDGSNIKAVIGSGDSWTVVESPASTDQWHHVAMVYSGGTLGMYLNGVSQETASGTLLTNDLDLYIGASQQYGDNWTGYIDETRIWNVARTETEIQENLNIEIDPQSENLLAYYDFNRGIPEGDNTAIENLPDMTDNNFHGTMHNFALQAGLPDGNFFEDCNLDLTAPVPDVENIDVTQECSVDLSTYSPAATDNCAGEIVGTTTDDLVYTEQGTYTITWTYDDGNGHITTQEQTVIVEDVTNPEITSTHNDLQMDADANCEASLTDYTGDVTASDNCTAVDDLTITQIPAAGTIISGAVNSVTLKVEDEAGNFTEVSFNVAVEDNTDPEITSTHNGLQMDADANCEASLPDYTADVTASDNCTAVDDLIVIQTPATGTLISGQTNPVNLRVEDEARNFTEVSFNVEVVDNTAPVADVIGLDDITAECEVADLTTPTATDNCSGEITGTHNASLPITSSTTITWTYEDEVGNTLTQTQEVVIEDVTAPTITCIGNQSVSADASRTYTVQGTEFDLVSTDDNCQVESIENNFNNTSTLADAALPESTTTITWTVTDNAGNTDNCTFDVFVDSSVGISELPNCNFSIYPSPFSNELIIETEGNTEELTFEILNAIGQIVLKGNLFEKTTVQTSNFAPGVYLIKLKNRNIFEFKKIIKE